MGKRGRTSAAALELLPSTKRSDSRPASPADLSAEQAREWNEIVARLPAEWFRRETYPILAEYCRCVVSLRKLNKILDGQTSVNDQYERLFGLIERERKLLVSLGRSMRLTQQATYDKKKSKGPTIPPPWED